MRNFYFRRSAKRNISFAHLRIFADSPSSVHRPMRTRPTSVARLNEKLHAIERLHTCTCPASARRRQPRVAGCRHYKNWCHPKAHFWDMRTSQKDAFGNCQTTFGTVLSRIQHLQNSQLRSVAGHVQAFDSLQCPETACGIILPGGYLQQLEPLTLRPSESLPRCAATARRRQGHERIPQWLRRSRGHGFV